MHIGYNYNIILPIYGRTVRLHESLAPPSRILLLVDSAILLNSSTVKSNLFFHMNSITTLIELHYRLNFLQVWRYILYTLSCHGYILAGLGLFTSGLSALLT